MAQLAADGQLRFADIVAGLRGVRAFAAEAGVALQQQWLGGGECQAVGESRRFVAERGPVAAVVALETPVADVNAGVGQRGRSAHDTFVAIPAGDALSVQQALAGQIGQCGMRKQQLPCGEAALQGLGQAGA